jgi:DNA-binding MarR family transcriptional regulator
VPTRLDRSAEPAALGARPPTSPRPATPATPSRQQLLAYGEDYLPAEVFKLGRDLRTLIDRELAEHGITTQQAAVMLVARLVGACSPGHLADPLGTDTAGMTRLVDRLEAKGFLARQSSPRDRRAVLIELTPSGQALSPDLMEAFRRAQERLLEGIEETEVQQFRATLQRLRHNLRPAVDGETC